MIKKLEVDGYRLLDGFEADLGGLTVVIGANGAGKSTLLDCLQLISQCAAQPVNAALRSHGGLFSLLSAGKQIQKLTWRVTFDRSAESAIRAVLPERSGVAIVYEVQLEKRADGGAAPIYEVLRYGKAFRDHEQPFKFLESRGGRRMIFDDEQKQLTQLPLFPDLIATGELGGDMGSLDAESLQGLANAAPEGPSLLLAEARFFEKYPVPSWVRLLFTLFAMYPGFRIDMAAPARRPSQVSPSTILGPQGDNLAAVLHEIFTRHDFREAAEEVRGFLKSAYPWVEDVSAETTWSGPGTVTVRIHEAGMQRPMELWDVSDGMLRFLCLQAALLNPSPTPFVAIDEPEVGLHPRLLPIVADIIKTGSERTQVLVTTHSPELLQCFDLEQIAVMTREDTRIGWYRPRTRESLRTMLEAVEGDTLADLHRSGELEAMP